MLQGKIFGYEIKLQWQNASGWRAVIFKQFKTPGAVGVGNMRYFLVTPVACTKFFALDLHTPIITII